MSGSQNWQVSWPFVTRQVAFLLAVQSLDGWPQGIPRRVRHRFELLESALEAYRRGLAAVHIPEFILRDEAFVPLVPPERLRVCAVRGVPRPPRRRDDGCSRSPPHASSPRDRARGRGVRNRTCAMRRWTCVEASNARRLQSAGAIPSRGCWRRDRRARRNRDGRTTPSRRPLPRCRTRAPRRAWRRDRASR